jgi:hypothetical protein
VRGGGSREKTSRGIGTVKAQLKIKFRCCHANDKNSWTQLTNVVDHRCFSSTLSAKFVSGDNGLFSTILEAS